ncbi:MAG: CoA pyrophosphatase [Rhodovulum sp.]|jgi:8-oxo-dGTP pyrophosphatase MutT (NUDIX family)|nr:CoA pyrophosphatase [Rhodovulum sp.]MCI5087171.1 CoA pyrophosphatase [Rhodovulum sp.]|tara:strand:+ start:1557 stop:2153 length:597 start_codon:yes stop_codon:yes gene_type:complete
MDTLLQHLTSAVAAEGTQSSDFDLNPDTVLPADRTLRAAGVLVGVMDGPDGPSVLLTKRSSKLKHHPGQIAFPGGKVDPDDLGPVQAALREAHEEVGLPPENVRVIGTMPTHETVTRFTVTPVLALIETDFTPVPEVGEVDEVFTVPLSHVTNPDRFSVEGRHWRGTRRHYFTVPYGPYYIWGATARILRGLADRWPQ